MFSIEFKDKGLITIGTICKDGKPVSPENSVNEKVDLAVFASQALKPLDRVVNTLVLSGMPVSFIGAAIASYKNQVSTLAVHNPRLGGAFVIHTIAPGVKVGDFIEL